MSAAQFWPSQAAVDALPRKRFTRPELDRLLDIGSFEGQRYELIDPDLIDKMGQKPPHACAIQRLMAAQSKLSGAMRMRCQMPIEVAGPDRERSQPEPDVAVLAQDKPDFEKRHPRGDELLLAVEVSDTTTDFDLSRKAAIYATAGVPEYWVLDLLRRLLVAQRQPTTLYRITQLFFESDTVSMEGRTETIRVSDLLPAPK